VVEGEDRLAFVPKKEKIFVRAKKATSKAGKPNRESVLNQMSTHCHCLVSPRWSATREKKPGAGLSDCKKALNRGPRQTRRPPSRSAQRKCAPRAAKEGWTARTRKGLIEAYIPKSAAKSACLLEVNCEDGLRSAERPRGIYPQS